MNKFLVTALSLVLFASPAIANTTKLELREETTVTLRGEIDDMSVAKVQKELLEKTKSGKRILLVLDTPGGSVAAGNNLADFIKGLPAQVDTLTVFAASMGFHIVQTGGKRYIVDSGILMSHRMAGGVSGQIPGELNTRLEFWLGVGKRMDELASSRMGIPLKDYRSLIADEYWIEGANAVKAKAADEVVSAYCNQELNGTVKETVYTFFGPIGVIFSKCPLMSGILDIDLGNVYLNTEEKVKAINIVKERFSRTVRK